MLRYVSYLVLGFVLAVCASCGSSEHHGYNHNYWNWPNYEGSDSYVQSAPSARNPKFAAPVEPSLEHETKIYGIPETDWKSMTPAQQKYAKKKYLIHHSE